MEDRKKLPTPLASELVVMREAMDFFPQFEVPAYLVGHESKQIQRLRVFSV
jgi:hypothetical protein